MIYQSSKPALIFLKFGMWVYFGMHHKWVKGYSATRKFFKFETPYYFCLEFKFHRNVILLSVGLLLMIWICQTHAWDFVMIILLEFRGEQNYVSMFITC